MEVTTFRVSFELDKKSTVKPAELRGFFATKFNEYILLHHHRPDGLLYQYPFVQYKVIDKRPIVVGMNEGAEVLIEIFNEYDTLKLGDEWFRIVEKDVTYETQEVGISQSAIPYSFVTPWAALNQENYMKYYMMKNSMERNEFLSKTLIGNLLSFSKAIGYTVPERLVCGMKVRPQKISLKNVHLMAFTGEFQVNYQIPDYFGLGKSVSRGFGVVRRKIINEKHPTK